MSGSLDPNLTNIRRAFQLRPGSLYAYSGYSAMELLHTDPPWFDRPRPARVSVLDTIAMECEAAAIGDFFATTEGRWFILQQRWKIEAEMRQLLETIPTVCRVKPPRLSAERLPRAEQWRYYELKNLLMKIDMVVEDPRMLFTGLARRPAYLDP